MPAEIWPIGHILVFCTGLAVVFLQPGSQSDQGTAWWGWFPSRQVPEADRVATSGLVLLWGRSAPFPQEPAPLSGQWLLKNSLREVTLWTLWVTTSWPCWWKQQFCSCSVLCLVWYNLFVCEPHGAALTTHKWLLSQSWFWVGSVSVGRSTSFRECGRLYLLAGGVYLYYSF